MGCSFGRREPGTQTPLGEGGAGSWGVERGAGGPSGHGGEVWALAMPALASKDEKLLINFCVFICAVMGLILINGTLLL